MRRFYKTLNKLRKLETSLPVKVDIVSERDLRGFYGVCEKHEKYFLIKIVKGNDDVMKLILIHEFAHALAWEEKETHGDQYGIAYARCWRTYTGEAEGS